MGTVLFPGICLITGLFAEVKKPPEIESSGGKIADSEITFLCRILQLEYWGGGIPRGSPGCAW